MKKLLMAAVVLGASVSVAQAATLSFSGSHDAINELDYFYFQNDSVGDVQIVMDTLTDGLDADMAIWTKVAGSSVPNLPEGSDWQLVKWLPGALRPTIENGANIFNVPLRNGYIPNDILNPGTSDPGDILTGLATGIYLISVGEAFNSPNAEAGQAMSLGFLGQEDFAPFANPGIYIPNYPHAYNFTITGDVSQVPLPAAAWLFGSALIGLGAVGRKKALITV